METSIQGQAELAPTSSILRWKSRAREAMKSASEASRLGASFGGMALAGLVLAGVGALLYRVSYFERDYLYSLLVDDAYISARHALNLVQAHGLNFNPNERVEGYTNFLFTLLMAVPQLFGWPLEPFMRALGCVTALSVAALTWRLASNLVGPVVATVMAAALLLDQRFVFFSTWGLETCFAALPCLLGYLWLFQSRFVAAGLAFAAGAMTRMDMVVLIAPAFFHLVWSPRGEEPALGQASSLKARLAARAPSVLQLGGSFAAVFGSYFSMRWYYYGWLLPNTFYAKVGEPGDSWRRGWAYLTECATKMGVAMLVPVVAFAWLACLALFVTSRKHRSTTWFEPLLQGIVFAAAAFGYLVYVVLVGGDHFAERFVYHAFPFILLASVVPFRWVWELLPVSRSRLGHLGWLPSAIFSAILAVALMLAPHRFGRSATLAGWASLGKYLAAVARPDALLATDAAGALPYYSGLATIDVLGLADLHTGHMEVPKLGSGPAGHEKRDLAYVLSRKPDYVSTWLDADGVAGRGFGRIPSFDQQYRLAALVRTDATEVTLERVVPFEEGGEPSRAELIQLRAGSGHLSGRYNWALYERRAPGSYGPLPLTGFRSNLPGWKPSGEHIVFAQKGHKPAHIMWGPFVRLPVGPVKGYAQVRIGSVAGLGATQRLCSFDVYDGQRSLAQFPLLAGSLAAGGVRKLAFEFELLPEQADAKLEFRAYCWGHAAVTVESIYLSVLAQ